MQKKMMKRFYMIFIALLIPLLMGMGTTNGAGKPGKIPIPAKKFQAVVMDQLDVVTEIHDVSIEGETFLEGKKGEGTFTVTFENLQSIHFLMNEGKLTGQVKLHDGSMVMLVLSKNKKVFGRTSYGTFQISLGDMKKMTVSKKGK